MEDIIQRKLQNDQRMIQEMSHLEKDRENHKLRKDWRDIFTWYVTGLCGEESNMTNRKYGDSLG